MSDALFIAITHVVLAYGIALPFSRIVDKRANTLKLYAHSVILLSLEFLVLFLVWGSGEFCLSCTSVGCESLNSPLLYMAVIGLGWGAPLSAVFLVYLRELSKSGLKPLEKLLHFLGFLVLSAMLIFFIFYPVEMYLRAFVGYKPLLVFLFEFPNPFLHVPSPELYLFFNTFFVCWGYAFSFFLLGIFYGGKKIVEVFRR